ncbi:MAG: DUF1415 domain-containing protein [Oligoflexus sp.]
MGTDATAMITAVKVWIEQVVIDLNLCPFAAKVFFQDQVRYVVCGDADPEEILTCIGVECQRLLQTPVESIATSLVLAPALSDFEHYLDILALAEEFLERMEWGGIFQIASFHPQYQFAEHDANDVSHYTNRSPVPIFHILREEEVAKALAHYDLPESIPERNIELMRKLGLETMRRKLQQASQILIDPSPDHANH